MTVSLTHKFIANHAHIYGLHRHPPYFPFSGTRASITIILKSVLPMFLKE
jgi:hypothetical protein